MAGKKWRKLVACQTWPDARERLLSGSSGLAVARWMQAQGDYTDVTTKSLATMLSRWLREEGEKHPANVVPHYVDHALNKLDTNLNLLEEMFRTLNIQKERVDRALGFEGELPMPVETVTRELEMYFDMQQRVMKMLQSMGLQPKIPERYQIEAVQVNLQGEEAKEALTAMHARALSENDVAELMRIERKLNMLPDGGEQEE